MGYYPKQTTKPVYPLDVYCFLQDKILAKDLTEAGGDRFLTEKIEAKPGNQRCILEPWLLKSKTSG